MNVSPSAIATPLSAPGPAPVRERLAEWHAEDGTRLACYEWVPEAANVHGPVVRGVVLAIHGLGGAGTDFRPLGELLGALGVAVYAPDLRGQGNDPVLARRGNIRDLREVVGDLRAFARVIVRRHPGAPLWLYGESMGGMLALHLAAGREPDPLAGLILASPVIAFEVPLGWWRRVWFRLLLGLAPTYRLPLGGMPARRRGEPPGAARVTRDEAYTEFLRNAPHRLRSVTPRFLHSLLSMIQECRDLAPALRLPVLMLYAGNDIFVRPAQVEAVFERIGSSEKTRNLFAESYHLLLHDHDRAHVLDVIRSWMEAHLA